MDRPYGGWTSDSKWDYIMSSATVLTQDPCPFGLPEIWTVAHMGLRVGTIS